MNPMQLQNMGSMRCMMDRIIKENDINPMMQNQFMVNQNFLGNNMSPMQLQNMQNMGMNSMQYMMNQKEENDMVQMQNMMMEKPMMNEDLGITVFFEFTGFGENPSKVSIQCLLSEKVSEVIKKLRKKSGDNIPNCCRFIFNAKQLNESLTVAEVGLTNHSNIFIVATKRIKAAGGLPMLFSDVSKNKTKELTFSKKAPSYRKVIKGINIFGICTFKKCRAYQKEVVVRIKKKKFDFVEERNDLFCPECEALIVPKTVGFYLCKFIIYGKKLENGQEQEFSNKSDEASNKDTLKYFDPELSGNVMITQLIFEVEKYL